MVISAMMFSLKNFEILQYGTVKVSFIKRVGANHYIMQPNEH